jgi:CelD/BcsL family acetyltransferase involved in cellulose biosynthesis
LEKFAMNIPTPRTIADAQGNVAFVQLPISEWSNFIQQVQRMETLLRFKEGLTEAMQQVRRIQRGEERGTTAS